jgi:uncharacterized protein (DUF885 family)
LADSPQFYYSDSGEGRDQILADYQAMIDEISGGLEPWFDVQPDIGVEVRRVPEFKEKTAPGGYYEIPAMDGSRPGVFYANLYDIKATPKYGMRTLAYHEAVPGHHFQLAIQQQQDDLPFFRRLIPFSAYSEGWGLYAERLAFEMGFLDNPYDNVGACSRAVPLRPPGRGPASTRCAGRARSDRLHAAQHRHGGRVVAEIERYFVMPGQATAYKVGMIKILELRGLAERELGEQFDIREFHNVILTNGSMPLQLLEELVRDYIARKKA